MSTRARHLASALERARVALAEAADLVAEGALDDIVDAAAPEVTALAWRISDTAAAIGSAAVERTDRCGVLSGRGFVSTQSWLTATLRWESRRSSATVRTARRLAREFTPTRDAWLAQAITGVHARVVADGLSLALEPVAAEDRDAIRREAEPLLLEVARGTSVDHTKAAVKRLRIAADPDGASAAAMAADAAQWVRLTHVGDGWALRGWLSDLTGAAVAAVLNGRRVSDHHSGSGPVADVADSSARIAHHNAVILGELARAALDRGDAGTVAGERPHLEVVVTLDELRAGVGVGELDAGLRDTLPLDIDSVRRIACDADVRRVVTTGRHPDPRDGTIVDPVLARLVAAPSEVVDYGRARRTVPRGLRRRVAHRDRGCVFPGCHRASGQTEAHHVQHWADGGSTSLDNLALLCSRHHQAVHHEGWTLLPRAGFGPHQPGYWQVHPPAPPEWAAA